MDFWHHILSAVEKRMGRQCLDTCFRPIVYQGREDGILRLMVPTESFKKCLFENYSAFLLETAVEIAHAPLTLSISVEAASAAADDERSDSRPLLIPKYTPSTASW
jgi:chromosomal replication initiation ATPase DnaA